MTELDSVLLWKLARIGQSEVFVELETLFASDADRGRAGDQVRLGHTKWLVATERWDDDAVVGLIKALVYAEREWPGWGLAAFSRQYGFSTAWFAPGRMNRGMRWPIGSSQTRRTLTSRSAP